MAWHSVRAVQAAIITVVSALVFVGGLIMLSSGWRLGALPLGLGALTHGAAILLLRRHLPYADFEHPAARSAVTKPGVRYWDLAVLLPTPWRRIWLAAGYAESGSWIWPTIFLSASVLGLASIVASSLGVW